MINYEVTELRDPEYAICPYCKEKHGDCWEWVRDELAETECSGCGKTYMVYAEYDVTYISMVKKGNEE